MRCVDYFSGVGGFTLGAKRAGLDVVGALNHWEVAVRSHEANHPDVRHELHDAETFDHRRWPAHDLRLFAAPCQGFSSGRGYEQPHHDALRMTSWAIVTSLEVAPVEAFVAENVPEMKRWTLWPVWCSALRALGYTLTDTVIDAADCGVPQNRKRLFVVGWKRGALAIPPPAEPHVAVGRILDWDAGEWKPWERSKRRAQLEHGRVSLGARFVFPYYSNGSGKKGRSIFRPIGTIPTKDRWGIYRDGYTRMMSETELKRAMSFREDLVLASERHEDRVKLLGNAVPELLAAYVLGCVRRTMEGAA